MEDLFKIPDSNISKSYQSLRQVFKARGWQKASIVKTSETCIFATRPDGREIWISFGTPPTTSYGAGRIADDKYISYLLLKDLEGVKQPETKLLAVNDVEATEKTIEEMLARYTQIVLKPFDGAHGLDVFVGISNLQDAKKAIQSIKEHAWSNLVLAQEMLKSSKAEVRAIVVDYHFTRAIARIPAHVTGDGQHTVLELIDLENANLRTAPYRSRLAYINKSSAEAYLKEQGDKGSYIPKSGEKVQVTNICNIGQGGTAEDVSDTFPETLKKQAETIAKQLKLPLVGIDYFDDYIIEVNKAPSLYYPVDGPGATLCVEKFVEYLECIDI
ncbi:hypothetical protein IJG78_02390 [Candidatus Saccharibacteria bacterium]|nr:hypothetical protein [Candidatus Saccharibacteria bacterium]